MRQVIFEKMLVKLFPDQKLVVSEYFSMNRYRHSETGDWVLDSPAIFVILTYDKFENNGVDLSKFFTDFTGREFIITRG